MSGVARPEDVPGRTTAGEAAFVDKVPRIGLHDINDFMISPLPDEKIDECTISMFGAGMASMTPFDQINQ